MTCYSHSQNLIYLRNKTTLNLLAVLVKIEILKDLTGIWKKMGRKSLSRGNFHLSKLGREYFFEEIFVCASKNILLCFRLYSGQVCLPGALRGPFSPSRTKLEHPFFVPKTCTIFYMRKMCTEHSPSGGTMLYKIS